MAITVASLITNLDTYLGDTSNDRVTAAERLQYLTEAVVWLQEELGNDHMIKTYTLPYFDNIHYYNLTSTVASVLEGADLRRDEEDQDKSFTHKSSREIAEEIGQNSTESAWSIERRDSKWYLAINHNSKYSPKQISTLESVSADGGTWEVDSTNSDATNLTVDSVESKQGSGSLNFDVDVSQSGNNRATIQNSTLTSQDLSDDEDLSSWIFWVYIPDVTYVTSVTFYWGTDTSNYWSASATTDAYGVSFSAGWNRIKIAWSGATMTGTPDSSDIEFIRFDINYSASQTDDTDFRIDDLTLVRPENLTFYYTSWYVGTNSSGTAITAFTATTDIPFFSGQYDQYRYPVSHKAAQLIFGLSLRLPTDANQQEVEALKSLDRVKKLIPSSVTKEEKNFKVAQIRFRKRR